MVKSSLNSVFVDDVDPSPAQPPPHTETAPKIVTRSVSSLTGPKWAPYRFQLGSSLISAVERNKRQQAACKRIPITSIAAHSSAEVKAPTQHTDRHRGGGAAMHARPQYSDPNPTDRTKVWTLMDSGGLRQMAPWQSWMVRMASQCTSAWLSRPYFKIRSVCISPRDSRPTNWTRENLRRNVLFT